MNINGQTEIFGLIGYPVSHSLSPKIHNFLFQRFELNCIYIVFNGKFEKKKDFFSFIEGLKKVENIKGVNITIPYKEWACEYTDNDYKKLGSINCLKFSDKIYATNTDIYGFKKAILEDLNLTLRNKNILVIGAGATARTIIYSVINDVKKIFIFNRTLDNAKKLINSFNSDKIEISDLNNLEEKDIDLIINSTPVGLHGERFTIDFKRLKKDCCVFDVIYIDTPLIEDAKKHGLKAINGKTMLVYQAIKSFEFWTELEVNEKIVKEIIEGII